MGGKEVGSVDIEQDRGHGASLAEASLEGERGGARSAYLHADLRGPVQLPDEPVQPAPYPDVPEFGQECRVRDPIVCLGKVHETGPGFSLGRSPALDYRLQA